MSYSVLNTIYYALKSVKGNVRGHDTLVPDRWHPALTSYAKGIQLNMATIGTVTGKQTFFWYDFKAEDLVSFL